MADDNLQTPPAPAIPPLALDLEQLHLRVQRMEQLLAGAESVLTTIRYDSPTEQRAARLIEFLGNELMLWREGEEGRDCASDDLWEMMDHAQHGKLIRNGVLERLP